MAGLVKHSSDLSSPEQSPSAAAPRSGSPASPCGPKGTSGSASSSVRTLLSITADMNSSFCSASATVVVLKSGVLLTRSPNPPSPPDGKMSPDVDGMNLVLTKVPGSSFYVPDPSGQALLFTLWLAIRYTELKADSNEMAEFKADMRDAMALAFKVPSSSITILDVSPAPTYSNVRRRIFGDTGDYVEVTMSATPSALFTSPSGWSLINNPLTYWEVNQCESMKPCLSSAFFTNNACEFATLDTRYCKCECRTD